MHAAVYHTYVQYTAPATIRAHIREYARAYIPIHRPKYAISYYSSKMLLLKYRKISCTQ
jgi:hypothetical protein